MAYSQFGYPVASLALGGPSQNSLLLAAAVSGSPVTPITSVAPSRPCETTPRPGDSPGPAPSSGAAPGGMCCYPPGAGLLGPYSRVPGLGDPTAAAAAAAALYGSPYPGGYLSLGADPSGGLLAPMCGNPGDLKGELGLLGGNPYFPAYDMAGYPYSNGRKNATRESTTTLKAWLSEHRKNPYPTKGEKIMLAIITKMTLTQVSTWFANARRRLKKDNKVTWSPRNRGEDDDDDDDADENADNQGEEKGGDDGGESDVDIETDDFDSTPSALGYEAGPPRAAPQGTVMRLPSPLLHHHPHQGPTTTQAAFTPTSSSPSDNTCSAFTPISQRDHTLVAKESGSPSNRESTLSRDSTRPQSSHRPKIWSVAAEVESSSSSSRCDNTRCDSNSSKDSHHNDSEPAHITKGPTQEPYCRTVSDSEAKSLMTRPGALSAFRPPLPGHPVRPGAGLPAAAWGLPPSGAHHPHPAYNYALSQHYLALSMAGRGAPNGLMAAASGSAVMPARFPPGMLPHHPGLAEAANGPGARSPGLDLPAAPNKPGETRAGSSPPLLPARRDSSSSAGSSSSTSSSPLQVLTAPPAPSFRPAVPTPGR